MTPTLRRQMWNRARDAALNTPRLPICQYCRQRITDGHSVVLHEKCADYLSGDVYRTLAQKRALARYTEEVHADAGIAARCSQADTTDTPATGSAPGAGVKTETEELGQ